MERGVPSPLCVFSSGKSLSMHQYGGMPSLSLFSTPRKLEMYLLQQVCTCAVPQLWDCIEDQRQTNFVCRKHSSVGNLREKRKRVDTAGGKLKVLEPYSQTNQKIQGDGVTNLMQLSSVQMIEEGVSVQLHNLNHKLGNEGKQV